MIKNEDFLWILFAFSLNFLVIYIPQRVFRNVGIVKVFINGIVSGIWALLVLSMLMLLFRRDGQ